MNTISARHGTRCRALYSFSLRVVLISSGGVFSGFISAQMTMYPENSAVSTNPGMKPARNTLMIDTSAATAYTTMMIDGDRKSTRLNSSHGYISYAVFCLKKKKKKYNYIYRYTSNHNK